MTIFLTTSGDSSLPIIYSVERVRDGRSFATRTVRSLQRGAVIFVLTASFHKYEPSPLAHGMPSPVHLLPGPETIRTPTPDEYAQYTLRRLLAAPKKPTLESKTRPIVARAFANSEGFVKDMREEFASRPIDQRHIDKKSITPSARTGNLTEHRDYTWFKANGTVSDDPRAHACALAYASDHQLLSTSVRAQGGKFDFKDIALMVSLDHVMYFHEVFTLRWRLCAGGKSG